MSKQINDSRRLLGNSCSMQTLMGKLEKVSATRASVLIVGESGVGKDLAARLVHDLSPRRDAPFVPVNCGAIPPELAESQLFGHEKGSFTGAVAQHIGFFEAARGGTIFLDEIAEMPRALQVKLLRALEANAITRVGGTAAIPLDVRIVAATHHDPGESVRDGRLREDLFYRIAVFALRIPALRQREDDIEHIARDFVDGLNARHQTRKRLSPQALKSLRGYPWPGNVRELRNTVERAYILANEQIEVAPPPRLPPRIEIRKNAMILPIGATLAHVQQRFIAASLHHFDGNKQRTAKALGISLKTLYNRLALMREPGESGSGP